MRHDLLDRTCGVVGLLSCLDLQDHTEPPRIQDGPFSFFFFSNVRLIMIIVSIQIASHYLVGRVLEIFFNGHIHGASYQTKIQSSRRPYYICISFRSDEF